MPRWVMKMSLPVAVRSTRVVNLSSSPVEYARSRTRPMAERMKSCGSLARFSAQSVSRMPASGRSWTRLKPLSFQNGPHLRKDLVRRERRAEPAVVAEPLDPEPPISCGAMTGVVTGADAAAAAAVAVWNVDALMAPFGCW
jgi:hypothetical protein